MIRPLSIPCPACSAASGVKCNTLRLPMYAFPATHQARANAAKRQAIVNNSGTTARRAD